MKKKHFILLAILMVIFSFVYISVRGRTYTVTVDLSRTPAAQGDYQILIEQKADVIALTDETFENGILEMTFSSISKGRSYVTVESSGDSYWIERFFVHPLGAITRDTFFGSCRGSMIIPGCVMIYLLVLLVLMLMSVLFLYTDINM